MLLASRQQLTLVALITNVTTNVANKCLKVYAKCQSTQIDLSSDCDEEFWKNLFFVSSVQAVCFSFNLLNSD